MLRRFSLMTLMVWAALCLLAAPAQAAPERYAEGLKAYRAGQHGKAYRTLLPLARKNDARAMYLIGVMYDSGQGVPQDDETAAGWLEGAARRGNAPAQYLFARRQIEGRGTVKNRDGAIKQLSAAAAQGHQEAIALLLRLDPARAAAAARVSPEPARTPSSAVGSAADPALKPADTLANIPANTPANTPVPAAFTPLARPVVHAALLALRGVLQRLAAQDDAQVRQSLPALAQEFARQYWHLEAVGDVELAGAYTSMAREHMAALTRLAREMSAASAPEAQAAGGLLARLTGTGEAGARDGCPATIAAAHAGYAFAWFQGARCSAAENAAQARDWMRMAAASGHAGAQESVGRSCIEGGEKNWVCAKEWLGRAANAGRSSAVPVLAWALANQPQPPEADVRAALRWYETAAGTGDAVAMNNLAALLERGPETLRDPARARDWYGRAARSGFGPAQLNLGRMLAQGEGGTANRDEAVEWLRKAEAAGVSEARQMREQISR